MAPVRFNLFLALVLLARPPVSTSMLRCHKGCNLSFGSVPIFYLWIDKPCDIGTKCMIQDISIKSTAVNYAYANLTFGGCFPERVERRLSCDTSGDTGKHITSDDIDEIGIALDRMSVAVIADLMTHAQEHLSRIFSFGNGIQDLHDGILDFLELAGYDRMKIRAPFLSYIRDFSNTKKLFKFMKSLQVDCDATIELSASMLRHLKRFSHKSNIPSYILQATEMVPRLIYPMVKSAIDDVDELFYEMAQIFKSPQVVPSEKACSFIAPFTLYMHVLMTKLHDQTGSDSGKLFDLMSIATKDITRRCSMQYPENERLERLDYSVEGFFSILKRSAKCNLDSAKCRQARTEAVQNISFEFFKMQQKKGSIQSTDFMYVVQDFNSVFIPAMRELRRNRSRLLTSPFTFIIDRTREQLLRYINFLQDKGEEVKKDYTVVTACEEYICKTSLCNSIANLNKYRMTKDGGISPKTEL